MRCSTCNRKLSNKPNLEVFTIDSGVYRTFCLDCIKMGYDNLSKQPNPTKPMLEAKANFKKFLDKYTQPKRRES